MSEPLKIVHIIPYYEPAWAYGGSPRVAVELCRRLAQRGHSVTVLTTDTIDSHTRAPSGGQDLDGVQVIRARNVSNRLAWNRIYIPIGFHHIASQFISQADVVHIHEIRSLLNAAALPALRSTPYIIMPHGGLPHDLGRGLYKWMFDVLWGKRLINGACRYHALTEMELKQWKAIGAPTKQITLIPNGIDPESFDIAVDLPAFRRRFDLPADALIVSFLGRLNAIKGLDELVKAFSKTLETSPEAYLLIAGPDDGMRASLEAQITQLGIGQRVRFTGMLSREADKVAVYRISSVYVLPSRYENLPTTVLEALLNATPCIVSDRCGLAPQLTKADAAAIMPSGDVATLSHLISTHLADPAPMRHRAEQAKQWVRQHFDWETVTESWEAVYQDCAQLANIN